jgi:hypothetical protein
MRRIASCINTSSVVVSATPISSYMLMKPPRIATHQGADGRGDDADKIHHFSVLSVTFFGTLVLLLVTSMVFSTYLLVIPSSAQGGYWYLYRASWTECIVEWVENKLVPPVLEDYFERRGTILCDDAPRPTFRDAIESKGALLVYLWPFSADFNPIELMFSYGQGRQKTSLERRRRNSLVHEAKPPGPLALGSWGWQSTHTIKKTYIYI